MNPYARDVVGYGGKPPNPRWPNGARLALNFVLNYEEGSEPSIVDGDGRSEGHAEGAIGAPFGPGERDLAAETSFEYGSRAGFWRITRAFDDRAIPLTVFACALALERNPPAAHAVAERGYDICCHGWRWVQMFRLKEDEEREHIRRAIESLKQTVGSRPLGWYCRYGPSVNTRRLLIEDGGFLYDSDAYNDDLPYWTVVENKPHLVVPYSLCSNDSKFIRGNFATGRHFFECMRDAIDVLRAEGATEPKMMSIGLHMRVIGQPARFSGLLRLLDHVKSYGDIWLCPRIDIARHWRATYPFEAAR